MISSPCICKEYIKKETNFQLMQLNDSEPIILYEMLDVKVLINKNLIQLDLKFSWHTCLGHYYKLLLLDWCLFIQYKKLAEIAKASLYYSNNTAQFVHLAHTSSGKKRK